MGDRLNKFTEKIAKELDFPQDVILGEVKITVIGNTKITIENHKGLISFDRKVVKFGTKIGNIAISGDNFSVLFMEGNTIVLGGLINSINYEGTII